MSDRHLRPCGDGEGLEMTLGIKRQEEEKKHALLSTVLNNVKNNEKYDRQKTKIPFTTLMLWRMSLVFAGKRISRQSTSELGF